MANSEATTIKPVKVMRIRGISASIFANPAKTNGKDSIFYKVSIQRTYKDAEEFKTTNSFSRDDLPLVKPNSVQLALGKVASPDPVNARVSISVTRVELPVWSDFQNRFVQVQASLEVDASGPVSLHNDLIVTPSANVKRLQVAPTTFGPGKNQIYVSLEYQIAPLSTTPIHLEFTLKPNPNPATRVVLATTILELPVEDPKPVAMVAVINGTATDEVSVSCEGNLAGIDIMWSVRGRYVESACDNLPEFPVLVQNKPITSIEVFKPTRLEIPLAWTGNFFRSERQHIALVLKPPKSLEGVVEATTTNCHLTKPAPFGRWCANVGPYIAICLGTVALLLVVIRMIRGADVTDNFLNDNDGNHGEISEF